jgi:hypothetical protein
MKANLPAESTPSREAKEAAEAEVVAKVTQEARAVETVEARGATPADPNPKSHCTICRDLEEEDYIWMGHDKSTCNRPGGGIGR